MTDAFDRDRTLSSLEWEAERNRAELMNTVEELRERVSPSHVKEDVKHYARSTGQDLVSNIVEKARDNPLQAAAIAAAVAYPAWHMVRSIPLPVLLLGAGAVLAGQVNTGAGGRGLADRFGWSSTDSGRDGSYAAGHPWSGRDGFQGLVDRNPMLVTGLGLLVGALIGGSLTAGGKLRRHDGSAHELGGMQP